MAGRGLLRGLTALGSLLLLLALAGPAAAHEQRQVGKYTLEVGWRDEPALERARNAVLIEVRETASGRGVPGLTKSLRVLVSFGGSAQTFEPALEAAPDEPGTYAGAIIPTRTGDYIFRVTGKIEEQSVDERFESGPGRFDVVRSPSILQFPDQTGGEAALAREVRALRESIDQLRLIAIAGLAMAIIALTIAIAALRRGARERIPVSSAGRTQ